MSVRVSLFRDMLRKYRWRGLAADHRSVLFPGGHSVTFADGTGYDLAKMAAGTTAGVLLLTKIETAREITASMIQAGILVVPVPLNRRSFAEAVNMMLVVHRRLSSAVPQTERLQQKIREIRLVDRAKCLLIQYEKMTEEEAHRYMEQEAMNRRVTRVNIAEEILQSYSG